MKIHKAKASNYNEVKPEWIVNYIQEYAYKIHYAVNESADTISDANKTQLKLIATELETVCKRLDYILEGKY